MRSETTNLPDDPRSAVESIDWYHTIDLGHGLETAGHYDHRPFLHHYGLPDDLTGKTALDIGAASGFFSFELERRGARVTATDLSDWFEHDFGPNYRADHSEQTGNVYLHEPFEVARQILGSQVTRKEINIYDVAPKTVGEFDLVFCGSVLVHLTDPIKALWNIASVTKEQAIIATVINPEEPERGVAHMIGYERGDGWWVPTRACFVLMAACAGFAGVEWISDFQLDFRDGRPGPYHGVLRAYKTTENWTPQTLASDALFERQRAIGGKPSRQQLLDEVKAREQEIQRLRSLVQGYERGRLMRLMRWIKTIRR